ncbi:hypothetical protein CRUP_021351, partial [Coryphaenoides rupestris]
DLAEIVGALARLISEVQEDVKNCKTVWNRVFVSTVQLDVFTVVYKKLDTLLMREMRETFCLIEGQMEQALANSLFPVYLSLQSIHKDKAYLQKRYTSMSSVRPSAFNTTLDRVERAVQVDQYLRSVLSRLPTQLNWAGLRHRTTDVIGESQFCNTLDTQIMQAQGILAKEIRSALDTLSKRLNTDIETHVKSMTTRCRLPSKSAEDAVGPLMGFLEKELTYMNESLVQENFNSLLTPLWTNSVKSLYQCLEQCFHAEGNGLDLRALQSAEYNVSNPLHRFNFNSDPFVQLRLEPHHVFPELECRCTQIRSCDLNPLFDEAFEFLISLEQCRAPGACLVVTVLDHDTLMRDDFEGEAFLAIKAVPGVVSRGDEAAAAGGGGAGR